uniref:G-protein coupled receptors family 2 profile 1 domain-containing protein n=1 Tax=Ascaris lumbricoides TaxID=6252 RepID=A0A0M3HF00_ASCLU
MISSRKQSEPEEFRTDEVGCWPCGLMDKASDFGSEDCRPDQVGCWPFGLMDKASEFGPEDYSFWSFWS